MSKLTRRRLLASGAAVSGVAIAGCIGGDDDDDDPEGGELHFTQQQERAEDFDPVVANDAYSAQVYGWVFDSLYEFDEGLGLEPKVATGDPDVERDGTRFIYEIHDGVEFSDGTELTAEDVEHSFIAPVLEQTDNAPSYDVIESTEILDDYQLQVDLEDPFGPWEVQTHAITIVNKEARLNDVDAYDDATPDPIDGVAEEITEYVNDDYNDNPVDNTIGSGPFEFEEFDLNEDAVLVRRDDYWDDLEPNLQRVTFVANEDPAGRVGNMLSHDTDGIGEIPNDDWDQLEGEPDIDVYSAESPTYMYMAFNCTDEADTSSPEVRRGVCESFSMTDFVDTFAPNTAESMVSPIPPITNEEWGFPMDQWREDLYPSYDPDSAQALLDEHAPDDFEPRIITPDGLRADLAERIATRLDEIGYGADVQQMDFGTLTDTYNTGDPDDYEIYMLGWTGGADPDVYLFNLFHESSAGVNHGHFYEGSDDFHDNIAAARASADQDERYDLYYDVQEEILEQLPALPAFTLNNTMAFGDHVEDVTPHPNVQTNPRIVSDYNNMSVQ